jgi:hypothetical protein
MKMSIQIESGEITDAIKLIKKECHNFDDLSAYEVNKLAIELVTASNMFDSATLISDSIDNLVDND